MTVSAATTPGQILTSAYLNNNINSGLTYIGSTTATSGTTVEVLGCFTATYDAYRIVISDARSVSAANLVFSCLAGAVINASNWSWLAPKADYTTAAWVFSKATSDSSCAIGVSDTVSTSVVMDVSQPFLSRATTMYSNSADARGTAGYMGYLCNGILSNTTSYSGLRITASAAITNMKVTVYGYRIA
jgi:hypothetical protein